MKYDGAAFIRFPPANVSVSTALSALGIVNTTMAEAITNSGLFPTPNSGNATLDVYNVSSRVTTDIEFRCLNQATIVSAVKNDVFPTVYAYEFDRSYQVPETARSPHVCILTVNNMIRRTVIAQTSQYAKPRSRPHIRAEIQTRLISSVTLASSISFSELSASSSYPTATQKTWSSLNLSLILGLPLDERSIQIQTLPG